MAKALLDEQHGAFARLNEECLAIGVRATPPGVMHTPTHAQMQRTRAVRACVLQPCRGAYTRLTLDYP